MNKIFEQLKKQRGIDEDFLHPKYEQLMDPFLLPDMEKAVKRIMEASDKGEKVVVYGDYDVDGVTASTVMEEALRLAGITDVEIMLPDRFADGYGMSPKLITFAQKIGAKLVVTVDCGSSNKEIVQKLTDAGIDTIVTDHHECPDELPKAVAVVNPKRKDFKGFRDLAGVGVAFKVAQGLVKKGRIPEGREKWLLDLVLIGTICDSMPMLGENRILGYYGMIVLGKAKRLGIDELAKKARIKTIDSDAIGYQLGPRLNAAGRLESAKIALDLVRSKSRAEAAKLAEKLEDLNAQRKFAQSDAIKEIEQHGIKQEKVIVEVGDWHEGVLGIVAGKLTEKYARPAFVLSRVNEEFLKGSGRSFGDFSLADALGHCKDTIISGGGHAAACGIKIGTEQVNNFRIEVNKYYDSLNLVDQEKYLKIHEDVATCSLRDLSLELLQDIKLLEPFGEGNSSPVFMLKQVEIISVRRMGLDGKHLRIDVKGDDGEEMKLLAFFAPDDWCEIPIGDKRDILVQLIENDWNGMKSVEGRIVDFL